MAVRKTKNDLNYANEVILSYKKTPVLQFEKFKQLNNSKKTSKFFKSIWNEEIEIRESFYLACFNQKMDVVCYKKIADGGIGSVLVDIRLLFTTALLSNATSIVVAHNHPSGSLQPSSQDIDLTKKIIQASKILSINLLDHIIITSDDYYSFRDNGDI